MRITIKNFKQQVSRRVTELPDKGLILLKGPTGSGKSTILDAIYDAVTGKVGGVTPWTGETPTENVLEFNGLSIVRSHRPESLAIDGGQGLVAQAEIYRKFGMNAQEFLASSYIQQKSEGALLLMPPAEQLRFIQRLAFGDQDPEVVRKKIIDMIVERACQIASINTGVNLRKGVVAGYANRLQELTKERPEQPKQPFGESVCVLAVAQLDKLRLDKESRRAELNKNVALANDKGHEALRRFDTVVGMMKALRSDTLQTIAENDAKLAKLPEAWAGIGEKAAAEILVECADKTAYLEWKGSVETFIERLKGKYPDFVGAAAVFLENKFFELDALRAKLGRRIIELVERITAAKNSLKFHKCPDCGVKLVIENQKLILATARADADQIEEQIRELEKENSALSAEEADLRQKTADTKADLKFARFLKEKSKPDPAPGLATADEVAAKVAEITAYSADQAKLAAERSQIIRESGRVTAKLASEEDKFAVLEAEAATARALLPKQETIQLAISALNGEVVIIEEEMATLNATISEWRKYSDAQAGYDRFTKEFSRAEYDLEKSETALTEFEATAHAANFRWAAACRLKELSDAAAIAATESIIANINEHARTYIERMFPDGGTSIRILSGFTTKTGEDRAKLSLEVIHRNKRAGSSIRVLSGGERDRAVLAFQLAMSTMYQSPILMIDEGFTGVDEENLKLCLGVLKEISNTKAVLVVEHGAPEGLFDQVVEIT
jgi:DNA repair exonuclease SbcCD ATPase subunit